MACNSVEMLNLSINDLIRIQKEFPDYYKQIFHYSFIELRNAWITRLQAMNQCYIQYIKQDYENIKNNDELLDDSYKKYDFKV